MEDVQVKTEKLCKKQLYKMFFEISQTEFDSQTGAKRVFVYEDDGALIMLTEKLYEGDEKLELMMIFEDNDDCCDQGPQDG
jgi:hypothetical protein